MRLGNASKTDGKRGIFKMGKTKTLKEHNLAGEIKITCRDEIARDFQGDYTEFGSLCRVEIDDKDNDRFTDAWMELKRKNNSIQACVSHEKGYPSEDKGTAQKCVKLHWLKNKLPKY